MNTYEKFYVEGGNSLSGKISPAGNKNEALPILSACLMTEEKITINNLPLIGDVMVMKEILESVGAEVSMNENNNHSWEVSSENIQSENIDFDKFSQLRASITLAAPLLYRCGKIKIPIPGGDKIGQRRIDTHLIALQEMGVEVYEENNEYMLVCKDGLQGADILLDEASVTGTENIIMAAACARGNTTIYNAACEPHVQQLCRFLNEMGAKISGIGSNRLSIEGVAVLDGTSHNIESDYLETGSFIGMAAVTKSELTIENVNFDSLGMIIKSFEKFGIEVQKKENDLFVPAKQHMHIQNDLRGIIPKLSSAIWPGLPADIMSILLVTATQCEGTVLIYEKLFESRLFFVDLIIRMGARIVLCDPHRAVIVGPSDLQAEHLNSPDIRAGVAMLIAAMCASGTSVIDNIHVIDRGYEKIDERLNAVGAKIQRVND